MRAQPRPPGPGRGLELGSIRDDPLRFLRDMHDRFGDVACHDAGGWEVTLVNRPELAEHVLKNHRANYSKSGTPDEQMLVPLLGRGLLTSEGEQWQRQRKLAQPAFRHRRIERFDKLMAEAAERTRARWSAASDPVRVDHDLTSLTLEIVAKALLGADLAVGNRFGEAVDAVNRFMSHYDPSPEDPDVLADRAAFRSAVGFLERIVTLLIDAAKIERDDGAHLLATLLAARTDDMPDGLSPRELRDQVVTLLMAGHETTAKALSWTLYLLDCHPEVRDGVEAELDDVLGERLPRAADLPKLPRCRHALMEAMRLYPPVWLLSRRAVVDDIIDGFHVPAGSLVCISPYMLHRRPSEWPDPDQFDPTRFEGERVEARPPFSFLPFSGGPRQCIGQGFAMVESQLVLATVCSALRMRLVPGHPVEPEALVTLRPRHGLLMTAEPRRA